MGTGKQLGKDGQRQELSCGGLVCYPGGVPTLLVVLCDKNRCNLRQCGTVQLAQRDLSLTH